MAAKEHLNGKKWNDSLFEIVWMHTNFTKITTQRDTKDQSKLSSQALSNCTTLIK